MTERIPSYSGRSISLLSPRAEDLCIEDMILSLARTPRFNGQTLGRINEIYSVAQHAVLLSYLVPQKEAFSALIHNLHTATIGEIISPVKGLIGDPFLGLKNIHQAQIHQHFDLIWPQATKTRMAIEAANRTALNIEKRDLFHQPKFNSKVYRDDTKPAQIDPVDLGDLAMLFPIAPLQPSAGYELFSNRFNQLCRSEQQLEFTRHA